MDFKEAAKLGVFLSKDYAEDLFTLLVNYKDISASEAASRLNLHIRTAQEFLEAMTSLGILTREEVYERKRPYFRYSLKKKRITMNLDLAHLEGEKRSEGKLTKRIRERKNAGARFTTARDNESISNVVIWIGEGRERKERRINLTMPQGKFLYHLPFPNAEPLSITEIMKNAGVEKTHFSEILDIVELLERYDVVEVKKKN